MEALKRVARQPVDQIEPIGGAGLVQQQHLGFEVPGVDAPVDLAQHRVVGALQADLKGTLDGGEEPGQFRIDEFAPDLEGEMDGWRLRGDEPQDGLRLALVEIEGGIQHEDLADPAGLEVEQLRLHAIHGHAPDARRPPGLETEIAAEGTAPGQFPEHARIGGRIQAAVQVGRRQGSEILHGCGAEGPPDLGHRDTLKQAFQHFDDQFLTLAGKHEIQKPLPQHARRIRSRLGSPREEQERRLAGPQDPRDLAAQRTVPDIDGEPHPVRLRGQDLRRAGFGGLVQEEIQDPGVNGFRKGPLHHGGQHGRAQRHRPRGGFDVNGGQDQVHARFPYDDTRAPFRPSSPPPGPAAP